MPGYVGQFGVGEWYAQPQSPRYLPEEEFVAWHQREVFRGPAREAAATAL